MEGFGGNIMRGGGFGLFGNLIVGMAGAFLGGFLLNALGIVSGSRVNPESYHFVSKGDL